MLFSHRRRRRRINFGVIAGLGVLAGMPKTPEESAEFQALCREMQRDADERIRAADRARHDHNEMIFGLCVIAIVAVPLIALGFYR